MGCFIDGGKDGTGYSGRVVGDRGWAAYLVMGVLVWVGLMGMKGWMVWDWDLVRAVYNWDQKKYNYNVSHYVIVNLQYCSLVYAHYYLFNFIFTGQYSPCLGSPYLYSSTWALFHDPAQVPLLILSSYSHT